nr:coronin-7-like [Pelodiscus sinensis]|eukprot:XP_006114796.1 coronin-7-like [Pelodiscus sinensis]
MTRIPSPCVRLSLTEEELSSRWPASSVFVGKSTQGHENNKDSRLLWLNASDYVLSVGFSQMREREVKLWDTRQFGSSLVSVALDTSPG